MEKILSALSERTKSFHSIFQPQIFRLSLSNDKQGFTNLLSLPGIMVYDEILGQVEELIKCRNPRIVFKKEDLRQQAIDFLQEKNSNEYGVWVYYPWNNKLVHLLDEQEYVEVRTNRNQYKITPEEEVILSQKKIGIIGLSVGQSIALTIAMERICGEIRLADFDKVELSNLNRIRTPGFNLEVLKVVAVAREIAEIDPFIKVTCFTGGLNQSNIDSFFNDGGKLDACIEVCDGLSMKILSRQKAKSFNVPVVMVSSDRGTTDVERYDLNPNLPLLHGLLNHLDLTKLEQAKTNEEKVPYLLPMLGLDTTSTRLRSSMLEIEQSITTWPQLASGVVVGGSICTDVCRRIFLGQFTSSGRFIVDLEDIITDESIESKSHSSESLISEGKVNYEDGIRTIINSHNILPNSVPLKDGELKELINAATHAPSGGNLQPWKWVYSNGQLYLLLDKNRIGNLLDFRNRSSIIALGASSENLVLKAHSLGYEVNYNLINEGDEDYPCIVFSFFKEKNLNSEAHVWDHLEKQIYSRKTIREGQRGNYLDHELKSNIYSLINKEPGAKLFLIEEEESISKLGEILSSVDRLRLMDEKGHSDFVNEIRWSDQEAFEKRDGIPLSSLDLTPSEFAGFYVSKDWSVVKNVKDWKGGKAFEKYGKRIINSSSAIGLITMPSDSVMDYFKGGRLVERLWLYLTEKDISLHPHTASIFMFLRKKGLNHGGLKSEVVNELTDLRIKFLSFFPDHTDSRSEIFLFRLNKSSTDGKLSLRRSINDVLSINS